MVPTTQAENNLYLSPNQQDLLLAALTSNGTTAPTMFNSAPGMSQRQSHAIPKSLDQTSYDMSNTPPPHSAALSNSYPHDTPLLNNDMEFGEWDVENDGTWDYEFGGDMMNESPGSHNSNEGEIQNGDSPHAYRAENEKRKEHPDGDNSSDPHDAEPKRRGAFLPDSALFILYFYHTCFFPVPIPILCIIHNFILHLFPCPEHRL